MKLIPIWLIVLFVLAPFSLMPNCWADDGPLYQNDGSLGPMVYPLALNQKSCIRMVKEYLTFNFSHDETKVDATFFFQNTDTQHAVTQLTGFPDVALGMKHAKGKMFTQLKVPFISIWDCPMNQ